MNPTKHLCGDKGKTGHVGCTCYSFLCKIRDKLIPLLIEIEIDSLDIQVFE